MKRRSKATTISSKTAALFFFFLWVITLVGFSYIQFTSHRHRLATNALRHTTPQLAPQIFQPYPTPSHTTVQATSQRQATIATTPFVAPKGHMAPFWTKVSDEMTTLSSKTIFESKFARAEIHQVRLKSGAIIDDWMWFEEPDQVNVVVQMSNQKLLLFSQSKYGLTSSSLAPVGGMVESGESPLQAAVRETTEEVNVHCTEWTFLGRYRIATNRGGGFCSSFLAQQCDRVNAVVVNEFDYEVQKELEMSPAEVRRALQRGELQEIKWTATFALALMKIDADK